MKRLIGLFLAAATGFTEVDAQNTAVAWSSFNVGFAEGSSATTSAQSVAGQLVVGSAQSSGTVIDIGYIPGVTELAGTTVTLNYVAEGAWNMVSLPLAVDDQTKTLLYPTAVSAAFAFAESYQHRDTLDNLVGYWIKFAAAETLEYAGSVILNDTADVSNSWNLIGSISLPVSTAGIIPIGTTVASNYFGFSSAVGYYAEDTLKPGRAYWVKASGSGGLAMTADSLMAVSSVSSSAMTTPRRDRSGHPEALSGVGTLTIRNATGAQRTLYFSSTVLDIDPDMYELPPPSPEFDVRFSTSRMLEMAEERRAKEVEIHISSAEYPLGLSWVSANRAKLVVGKKRVELDGSGEMELSGAEQIIKLRLPPGGSIELPKAFALRQNYPNPFNPTTTIAYEVPYESKVTIKIYDVLGQAVRMLVDAWQEAGYQSIALDAHEMSSGVYFYQMQAGTFIETKKLVLMK